MTVVGEPGVGKSRLAAELLGRVAADARIARGACLSYGEGITFWPVAQVVRALAGIRDEDSIEEARARVPQRIAQLVGLAEGSTTADQTAEAVAVFLARGGGRPAARRLRRRHPLGGARASRPAGRAAGAGSETRR